MPSSSVVVRRAPVGLFGLQMMISFVRGPTSGSSASRSARHFPERGSCTNRHSRIVAPNARATPQVCMYDGSSITTSSPGSTRRHIVM
jgi:hypothetical protein